ncbi:MAG: hypothetical protein JWO08_2088 [Verrucomicrobiaceae bacterium]|nr:hypothetical protein [Verrucomicrobiaceae bacterium]
MELFALLGILLVLWLLVGPIIALVKASKAARLVDEAIERFRETSRLQSERMDRLMQRLEYLEASFKDKAPFAPQPIPEQTAGLETPVAPSLSPQMEVAAPITVDRLEETQPGPVEGGSEYKLPDWSSTPVLTPEPTVGSVDTPAAPPPLPPPFPRPVEPVAKAMSFEQFLGVKMFAWVGGLALFLGIVFFVKYAFERDLIPPAARIAIGFITGMGLLGGGLYVQSRKHFDVLAQTLCATGVLVLYGVTFAAHALYHFAIFNSGVTFGVMTLVTAVAFLLSVRMNAQVVAVLGMVGGFLTPVLCSTGQDNPGGLFGYIALLDIGLLAVAKRQRWLHLTALAAAGTAVMQFGWFSRFGYSEHYFEGAKTWVLVTVFAGFAGLFTAAAKWSRTREDEDLFPAWSALGLCGSAMIAAFTMLDFGSVTERPVLLYSLVLLANAAGLFIAWAEPRVRLAPAAIGLFTFIHLMVWTCVRLTTDLLPTALVIYLVFGLMHTAFGVLWQRKYPGLTATAAHWVPVDVLLLGLLPIFVLREVSFFIWPALLVTNLLVIGLAFVTRKLLPVLASIVLTLVGAGAWLMRMPDTSVSSLPAFLFVVGGFAVFFIVASCFLSKRVASLPSLAGADPLAAMLPVSSAVLPFALLIMATVQLPVANPAPIFGLGLLLCSFLLGLARVAAMHALGLAALICTLALEYTWHVHHFNAEAPVQPLLWYLGFYALFAAFPFVFRRAFRSATLPWIASAAAGIGTFGLVHRIIALAWPNSMMGLLPAAFVIPSLLSLVVILKQPAEDGKARLSQLAWFGGVALFFITLIFPLQFDRQWITIGWALEGAALIWLYRRVPHKGLHYVGAGLLTVAFVRLALNPAVLSYATHTGTPIVNWFLYAYGLVAVAQFMGARWLAEPNIKLGDINLRGLFCAFGGVLLFLLMNIEIADAFTPVGEQFVTFQFEGNLARDMTYSIGWGLFALGLLMLGFRQHNKPVRYAGMALLVVTLLKLFFHDLATIDSIYRIGALMAVAIIALFASFLYQRFLNADKTDRS